MELVVSWWDIVSQLAVTFSRKQTFWWAALTILGFCTRQDSMGGVTGLIRSVGIKPKYYQRLDDFFHSNAIKLDKLSQVWVSVVLKVFKPFFWTLNGHKILVLDGINNSKEGKKMPGVQSLHQSSDNNSKPSYIMGHFLQCVGILAGIPGMTMFCVFLFGRIHLGTKECKGKDKTLFDKAVNMLDLFPCEEMFYLIADAYYGSKKMLRGVIDRESHLITRVKSSAVVWYPAEKEKGKRKREKKKRASQKIWEKSKIDQSLFRSLKICLYSQSCLWRK